MRARFVFFLINTLVLRAFFVLCLIFTLEMRADARSVCFKFDFYLSNTRFVCFFRLIVTIVMRAFFVLFLIATLVKCAILFSVLMLR